MTKCVNILDEVATSLVDAPEVSLPQICNKFERPLACPEVDVQVTVWFISGVAVRAQLTTVPNTQLWSRMRDTVEDGSTFGAWSDWYASTTNPAFVAQHDQVLTAGPFGPTVAYEWYDAQFLVEPVGLGGYQEISPLCGGFWHFQTPKKFNPDPDPPAPINPI